MPKLSMPTFLREVQCLLHRDRWKPEPSVVKDLRAIAIAHLLSLPEIAPFLRPTQPLVYMHGADRAGEALDLLSGLETGLDLLVFIRATARINPLVQYISLIGPCSLPADPTGSYLLIRTESRDGFGVVLAAERIKFVLEREELYAARDLDPGLRLFDSKEEHR